MDMLDQLNAVKKIEEHELAEIIGGASLSGTLVNAFTSAYKTLYGFGQNFGTAIRRIVKKKLCSF